MQKVEGTIYAVYRIPQVDSSFVMGVAMDQGETHLSILETIHNKTMSQMGLPFLYHVT